MGAKGRAKQPADGEEHKPFIDQVFEDQGRELSPEEAAQLGLPLPVEPEASFWGADAHDSEASPARLLRLLRLRRRSRNPNPNRSRSRSRSRPRLRTSPTTSVPSSTRR